MHASHLPRRAASLLLLCACQATPPQPSTPEPTPTPNSGPAVTAPTDDPELSSRPSGPDGPAAGPPIRVDVKRGPVKSASQRHRVPHPTWIGAIAWSPDASRLATGDDQDTARVFDASTAKPALDLPPHERRVSALTWSPDGARLVVAALTDLRVWNMSTGALEHRLPGHGDIIDDLLVIGDTLHAVDLRNALRRWDLRTGAPLETLEVPTIHKLSLALDPTARALAMGGYGDLELLDLPSTIRFKLDSPRCDPKQTNNDLMCAAWKRTRVEEFGYEGSPPSSHEEDRPRWYVQDLAFSADGKLLLIGRADGVAVLIDTVAGRPLARIESAARDSVAVDLTPDGATAALASRDGHVLLWDFAARKPLAVAHDPDQIYADVAFSPDAAALAAAGPGPAVTIWDLAR